MDALLQGVIARLCEDFHTDADTVGPQAEEIFRRRYADARVHSFIPILVERELREVLRKARHEGATPPQVARTALMAEAPG